jgi:hypothetical protein
MRQNINQTKPSAPIRIKAVSQPHCFATHGTVSGANIAPTLVPELNMPVAKERSFLGKYSAVALRAEGKLPASPTANNAREIINPIIETGVTAPSRFNLYDGKIHDVRATWKSDHENLAVDFQRGGSAITTASGMSAAVIPTTLDRIEVGPQNGIISEISLFPKANTHI